MTLGCLAPYRRLGIGRQLLNHILSIVREDGKFTSVCLHVQINNEDAIEFYKAHGFEIKATRENYYQKVTPADAHWLVLELNKEDGADN